MTHATRKWSSLCLLLPAISLLPACQRPAPFNTAEKKPTATADAPFDPPNSYPEWAFDSPQYIKPAQELTPEPKVKPGDPLHYFTKEKVVLIRQPSGYTPEEIPRVAVWWSDNNGFRWQKAGYFGREQSYFAFEVQEDGDYGVRFVGPNQEQAIQATAYPERVYHVDTVLPEVEVTIDPEQTWYNVGQSVTVSWRADDFHLIELPVTLTALLDFTAEESKPIEIQKGLAKDGSVTFQIPPESLNHEIRFRVDALDRANNLGIAYSYALQVVSEPVDQSSPRSKDKQEDKMTMKTNAAKKTDRSVAVHAAPRTEKVVANPSAKKISSDELTEEETPVEKPMGPVLADALSHEVPEKVITPLTLRAGVKNDITQGNGLLVPLPATVDQDCLESQLVVAHPWRALTSAIQSPIKSIWSLPIADFVQREPRLRELFLAGARMFYPLGEPAEQQSHVVLDTKE